MLYGFALASSVFFTNIVGMRSPSFLLLAAPLVNFHTTYHLSLNPVMDTYPAGDPKSRAFVLIDKNMGLSSSQVNALFTDSLLKPLILCVCLWLVS